MKKLKKILLINWLYFSKELIEVGDINFLTGKNGAGKSTVIDALQIVLLGETNARNFNQAANEKSQRTLDGYLRADMDEHNPHSRRGKDFSTYIACEWQDELNGGSFVTGVLFDCRSDGGRRDYFFTYTGTLPANCFIEQGEAMEIADLRRYLKENYTKVEFYDSQKDYRRDMLAKWNIHSDAILRLMKKAISFRPIVDIQKFITENICDIPDRPDIELMQQNIRDYKRHEQLAQRQEEKLAALRQIGRLFQDMNLTTERWQIQSFLVQWAEKELAQTKIDRRELDRQDCIHQLASVNERIEELSRRIEQREERRRELEQACAQSDVYQEENRLRERKRRLQEEQKKLDEGIQNLAQEIRRESQRMTRMTQLCPEVPDRDTGDGLASVRRAAESAGNAFAVFADGGPAMFSGSAAPFRAAQEATDAFYQAARSALREIENRTADWKRQKEEKTAILTRLRENIKDYPRGLIPFKEQLEEALRRAAGQPISVHILADLLEVSDERWRGAVEGYLNSQKFYLLVEPEHYPEALRICDRLKNELQFRAFGLVDIEKLREKETIRAAEGSLADMVETDNPLARSYVDYLLGRVMRCDRAEQLRGHKTAITADGMLYQGYVARPLSRDRMEDAYIGRRAVQLQRERLEKELAQLESELQHWSPIQSALSALEEPLFTPRFVEHDIAEKLEAHQRCLAIDRDVTALDEQLARLDLLWLDEQRRTIETLKTEIRQLDREKDESNRQKGQLEERIRDLEEASLPEARRELADAENLLNDTFPESYRETVGIPRYTQEFARLRSAEKIRRNFNDSLAQSQKARASAQAALFAARREYADTFKPCSFLIEAMDNDEFAAEQRALEESELPQYREKIRAARESAMEQFRNDFLAKLKSSIDQVKSQVRELNRALKQAQFGTDRYQFCVERNPDYAEYYDMIMAPELMEGDLGLLAMPFQEKYGPLIEKLFSQITTTDDTQLNARKQTELQENIVRYTDFRTYLRFDLETTDQNGSTQLLSQTLNTKSGGETQTPFYIAVLASFAQQYRVNETGSLANSVRLVVFDEAFNKMDSDRITESVRLLRKMGLQAIICTPPDKVADIMPLADRTLLVDKSGYRMHILPFDKEYAG